MQLPFEIIFGVLALIVIATGLGMLISRNAIYSVMFLVINFTIVAMLYLTLGAPFIALSQITVYAGAIMVLFLFVIMLLGAENLPAPNALPWQKPLAIALAAALFAEAAYLLIVKARSLGNVLPPAEAVNATENLRQLGVALFQNYLLPFEIVSILLLVAMIGAITLTKKEKGARNG